MFFFFLFHFWLNKIHLCKQTQDKALTKTKQARKQTWAFPTPKQWDWTAHPLSSSLACPRGVIIQFPFTWAAGSHYFPPTEEVLTYKERKVAPKYFKTSLHIVHWSIGLQFPCKRFLQSAVSRSIEKCCCRDIFFSPPSSRRNGFKSWAECPQALHPACKVFKNSASWYWSLECVTKQDLF